MDVAAGTYSDQWQDYRRRHRAAVIGLLVGLPVAFIIALPFIFVSRVRPEIPMFVSVLIWGAIWGRLAFHVAHFPCPRCGMQLQSGNGCDNCKLLLYEGA